MTTQAKFALSVLDNTFTGVGETTEDGYRGVIDRAKLAEELGYTRFWLSEHHSMPGCATPSPPLFLARLTAETSRIRLGAGGVMLPNHAPLVIAEQFNMLEAFAPGRIDLGLGRAPGTDGVTAAALRRGANANDHFPQQVAELLGFMNHSFPAGHRYAQVRAVPGPWQASENRVAATGTARPWILGTSPASAHLAARIGLPYGFALQFGDADVDECVAIYREEFQPSESLDAPYVLVSAQTTALPDAEEARREAHSYAMAMLRMFKRQSFTLYPPAEVLDYHGTLQERYIIDSYVHQAITGDGAEVAQRLEALQERTQADELMIVVGGSRQEVQLETVREVARAFGMGAA